MEPINNYEDVIDSRDIIDRIEELESDEGLEGEEKEELKNLKALTEQANSSEWEHGQGLIRESYWAEYCEELCKDIGDIPENLPWYIENHIDWEGVSREIAADYAQVDFDGVTYYIRED